VVATASIQRIGGTVAYTSMALYAGDFDGEILATANGAYRLFHPARPRPKPEPPALIFRPFETAAVLIVLATILGYLNYRLSACCSP
jgi:hypothetical protein